MKKRLAFDSTCRKILKTRLRLPVVFFGLLSAISLVMILSAARNRSRTAEVGIVILDTLNDTKPWAESPGIWSIYGWNYFSTLDDMPAFKSKRNLQESPHPPKTGIWILARPGDLAIESDTPVRNWFKLSHFQYQNSKHMLLGIRFYIEGSGQIKFKYSDSDSELMDITVLGRHEGDSDAHNKGFCNKIIMAPESARFVEKVI